MSEEYFIWLNYYGSSDFFLTLYEKIDRGELL